MRVQRQNKLKPDSVVMDKKEGRCLIIDIARPFDTRTSEEKLEKYQKELKRIWKCKEALGALEMVSTSLRKSLQVLKTYPRNYSAATEVMLLRSEQLACEHRSISGRRFFPSPGISMERSDDLKYGCARRIGNSKDPQKRIGHGWNIKSHQQKGPNKTRNII